MSVARHQYLEISDGSPRSAITGLVLAGGLGRRMGGVDKGLADFRGRPLAVWAVERLRPQVGPLWVNANRNAEAWREIGDDVIADQVTGFVGPLAGVHAGLAACTTPYLATVPCDSPFFPLDLVARLATALRSSGSDVAVARTPNGLQPVFLLLKREALPHLQGYLASGERKAERWLRAVGACEVDFPADGEFANLNTHDDLNTVADPDVAPAADG